MESSKQQNIASLLPLLKNLPAHQKLLLIQFLAAELAQQESGTLIPNLRYPVWSPYHSYDAAETLLRMLNEPESPTS